MIIFKYIMSFQSTHFKVSDILCKQLIIGYSHWKQVKELGSNVLSFTVYVP